jgi:hypothetical protein
MILYTLVGAYYNYCSHNTLLAFSFVFCNLCIKMRFEVFMSVKLWTVVFWVVGGNTLLWNISNHLQNYTSSQLRRPHSMIFEVFTAVNIWIVVLCVIMLCSFIGSKHITSRDFVFVMYIYKWDLRFPWQCAFEMWSYGLWHSVVLLVVTTSVKTLNVICVFKLQKQSETLVVCCSAIIGGMWSLKIPSDVSHILHSAKKNSKGLHKCLENIRTLSNPG